MNSLRFDMMSEPRCYLFRAELPHIGYYREYPRAKGLHPNGDLNPFKTDFQQKRTETSGQDGLDVLNKPLIGREGERRLESKEGETR